MSLHLVTGPANSAKAQVVLDRYERAIERQPLLVVPTSADAEHYRRELAERGVVFGVRVERFAGLLSELARRAGIEAKVLGPHVRARLIAAAIGACQLDVLGRSAQTPGFAQSLADLIEELQAFRVTPQRLRTALRAWGGAPWGDEVSALYAAYHRSLERLGAVDEQLRGWRALDAVRQEPRCWGETPVFFYGFDDLDGLQRDAVVTLADAVGVAVTLSLPYEAGRVAFAGRARNFEDLRPSQREQIETLPPRDDYYDDDARATLHLLERSIFEEYGERSLPLRAPGPELRLLASSSQREEYGRLARLIAELMQEGFAAYEIALVTRASAADRGMLAEELDRHGVPYAPFCALRFGDTSAGHGLLCLLRSALLDGGADELIGYLRAPGVLDDAARADDLEARVRRSGVRSVAGLRALWKEGRQVWEGLDQLKVAARSGPVALIDSLGVALDRLASAGWQPTAAQFGDAQLAQVRCVAAAATVLRQLRNLALRAPNLAPGPAELHDTLARLEVEPRHDPFAGVQVCDPLRLRARRMRVVVLCGLQSGSFPRAESPQPFFGPDDRAALARASGLLLERGGVDALSTERYLFYAVVSRPTARLVLSWHEAGDDGQSAQRSLFVDDVLDVVDVAVEGPHEDVVEGPASRRAPRLGVLRAEALQGRELSPSSLEYWSECPAAWLIDREIGAQGLQPDAEPLARGSLAHEVLERVLRELRKERGSARISEGDQLAAAEDILRRVFDERAPLTLISVNPLRQRVEAHRLHEDLARYLRRAAVWGSSFEPSWFELSFGLDDSERDAVALAGGELVFRGRIDRVDVDAAGTHAVIHDYKGSSAPPAARWIRDSRFQLALYMLAAQQLLGLEVAGGFYQPLRGGRVARGVLRDDIDLGAKCLETDRYGAAALSELLEGALELALCAARELHAGAVAPRPQSCGGGQGCRYPAFCRMGGQ